MRSVMSIRNWKSALFVVASATVVTVLMLLMLTGGDPARVQAQTPDDETPKYANMDAMLNEIVEQHEMGAFTASAAGASGSTSSGGSIGVIFLTESDETEGVREFLAENGASPGPAFDGFVGADVPVSLLASASEQDGVEWMQADIPPRVAQTEGPPTAAEDHGADVWHAAGLRGEGVKIGVISHGFEGFQSSIEAEKLPASVEARCYSRYGLYSTDISNCVGRYSADDVGPGTVITEAVYSIAPDATYYIASVHSSIDLFAATRWMVENEVDVIESSVLWSWSGPGDGTSPLPLSALNTVDDAIAGGAVWVSPAGNDGKATWFGAGSFTEGADGRKFHYFDAEDECNGVEIESGTFYYALLRWEGEWGEDADDTNLNMYLVDEETSTTIRRSFHRYWDRNNRLPLEYLYFYNYGSEDGIYCLRVELNEGDAPDWIQLQSFYGEVLEHHTFHGSIASPSESANPGLLSVGAASLEDPNVIWELSSRGPAPDGRLKPELVGAQHESEAALHGLEAEEGDDEYVPGTSHEAADVAGLAALVKQRFPEYGPEEIAEYLKSNAQDRGEPGPDNTWGYGYAYLPASDVEHCIASIEEEDQAIEGTWDEYCLSENRPNDGIGPGSGDYYARFYTVTLGANKKIEVSLSSEEDTYLYLMRGAGKDGTIETLNDDIAPRVNLNSRIEFENSEAGEFTIEATTYGRETSGEFTLAIEITNIGGEPEPEPQPTPSASGPFIDFSRGTDHVCALSTSGVIYCWGDDYDQADTPSGQFSALSSGEGGSCALRDDGAALCWGSFDVSPSSDHSASGPFTDISRGSDHACALDSDGAITCWGDNDHGQASPPPGEFSAIGSHEGGSCALRNDDALVCWGGVEVSP